MAEVFLTVTELNKNIKINLEDKNLFNNFWVSGEISNITLHKSGHIYFSLKDSTSSINCMVWKTHAHKFIDIKVKDGIEIKIFGRVTYYVPNGRVSFEASEVKLFGIGELTQIYNERYEDLKSKGWFDSVNKKNIPKIPKNIGIVTALTGDAVQDIIRNVHNKFPLVNLFLFSSLVQGDKAANDIAKKIMLANNFEVKLDLLIVGRGGGSYEDLWPFNEMEVLEATRNSNIPIISAVGHEPDITLIDYVADKRSSTPTSAANESVPDIKSLKIGLSNFKKDFSHKLKEKINNYNSIIKNSQTSMENKINTKLNNMKDIIKNISELMHIRTISKIDNYSKELVSLRSKFLNRVNFIISALENKLNLFSTEITLKNPKLPFDKGFALIKNTKDNKVINSQNQLNKNEEINIEWRDFSATANIKDIRGKNNERK